jgi:hypothetical protein
MWTELKFGTVIFYKDFPFLDLGKSDKLIVVLGIRSHCALIALTTSQPPEPDVTPGCHAKRSYFRVQKHSRDCFDVDTYIQLYRMGELLPSHVDTVDWRTNAKIIGTLSQHTASAIKNCAAQTDDISPQRKALLGP